MPESVDDTTQLDLRDYVDRRLDQLRSETATRASELASRPGDAISLKDHIETLIRTVGTDAAADCTAIRTVLDLRITLLETKLAGDVLLLREIYDARNEDIRGQVDRQFIAAEHSVQMALDAVKAMDKLHGEAHAREHASQDTADSKTEARNAERFYQANRFREQIEQERLDYVRRDVLDTRLAAIVQIGEKSETDLRARIETLAEAQRSALTPLVAFQQNMSGRIAVWGVVGTILLTVIVFLANFLTST